MFKKLTVILFVAAALLTTLFSAEKYAVLITGDYAADGIPVSMKWQTYQDESATKPGAMECFWNDTFLMWKMLIDMGYEDDNIYVLFADGEDFSSTHVIAEEYDPVFLMGDGYIMTDYSATVNNINIVVNELEGKLTKDDFLFVWTFDHGGFEGIELLDPLTDIFEPENEEVPSFLVLLNDAGDDYDRIYDDEFGNLFNPLTANKKVYWMQQCFSGGFMYEMTHDISDQTIPYGSHPELDNVFFNSASTWKKPARTADDYVVVFSESGEFYRHGGDVENEVIDSKKYMHGEYNFHMMSATQQKRPDGNEYYYEDLGGYYTMHYSEVDGYLDDEYNVHTDDVICVKETQVWDSVFQSSYDGLNGVNDDTMIADYSDCSSIGYYTAIQYPTIIHNEFDIPTSYVFQPLNGEIYVIKDIDVDNGQMTLSDNSETTMFEDTKISLYSQLTVGLNSVLKGTNNNIIISRPYSSLELNGCTVDNVDFTTEAGSYNIVVENDVNINNSEVYVKSERVNSLSTLEIKENSSLSIGETSIVTMDVNSELNVGVNSSLILKAGTELYLKNGSLLTLTKDSRFIIEDGANVIMEEGAQIIVEGNANIFGDLTVGNNAVIDIKDGATLSLVFAETTVGSGGNIKLQADSKLINLNGSRIVFENGSLVEASKGSEIIVMTKGYFTADGTTFAYADESGTWLGINAISGSSIELDNVTINGAETAVKGMGNYEFDITNSNFEGCINGIDLVGMNPGYAYSITDNTITGVDDGRGISITSSDGVFSRNNISHFNTGVYFIMSSPAVSKCNISYNKYFGITISGHDAIPQLINTEQVQAYGELNCTIEKNGYVSNTSLFPSGNIGIIPVGSIYMRYNDVYSSPRFPGISIAQLYVPNSYVTINAQYNYWGAEEINDDYFFGHTQYTIDYTPYNSSPGGGGINPTSMQDVSTESRLLSTALNLETKDKDIPAIKLYENIIRKYEDSPEYYVAMARLPYLYEKAELDNNVLIRTYDEAIESENTSHKKFFKGKKVATHIKGKRYDSAITIAEEMKDEAEIEEEIILADINIAIANMFKDLESEEKSRSSVDHSSNISDLLAKLNGDDDEVKTDIVESALPTEFTLYQNYPNPFNPTTEIKFALPTASDVKLNVYNINGQLVSELVNGSKEAGIHSVNFDGNNLNSGMYFYTLEANGVSITKKMILTK